MKIPKTLRICGQTITIVQKKDPEHEGIKMLGLCDANNCTITLKKNIPNEKKKEVLLHECIHMICENMNVNISENTLNTIGVGVLSLLTVNKLDFLQ